MLYAARTAQRWCCTNMILVIQDIQVTSVATCTEEVVETGHIRRQHEESVICATKDTGNPMNPHGLLIAYAEAMVKPVVSEAWQGIVSNGSAVSPISCHAFDHAVCTFILGEVFLCILKYVETT